MWLIFGCVRETVALQNNLPVFMNLHLLCPPTEDTQTHTHVHTHTLTVTHIQCNASTEHGSALCWCMGESGNGRIQVRPGLGRDGGIERERERGVVWTDWGCHGNPAAKSRQGQCGRETVCSRIEGMPPGGRFGNYTNTQLTARVLAENVQNLLEKEWKRKWQRPRPLCTLFYEETKPKWTTYKVGTFC